MRSTLLLARSFLENNTKSDQDPYEFYRSKFPKSLESVRSVAAMFMSHKAGSAASECVFRDSTQVLTKYRLRASYRTPSPENGS